MKQLKKLSLLILSLAFLIILMPTDAKAASKPAFSETKTTVLACTNHSWSDDIRCDKSYKIISVTSSNKQIVSIEFDKKSNNKTFGWSGLKAGKATITAVVSVGSKKYTLKRDVTVVADKPFEYIKYGNKNIYKGNEYVSNFQHNMKNGKKLTWKLKPGYKIVKAYYDLPGNGGYKTLKNGTTFNKLSKTDYTWCFFTIKNPKGQTYEYRILLEK